MKSLHRKVSATRLSGERRGVSPTCTRPITRRARASTLAWVVLLLAGFHANAQEQKLERKERPPAEAKPAVKEPAKDAKKDEPAKDAKKDEPALDPGEEAKQILERIGKNMRAADERLKAKDASDATQQVQRDIVKDLDKLIQHQQNQDQQQQQQQDQQASAGGGPGKSGGKSSRTSRAQQRAQNRSGSQSQPQPGGQQGNSQGQASKDMKGGSGNQGVAGNSSGGLNKTADVHKDIWGHLPEALRLQMDAYGREGYMLKYQDLLRQYYATIAEKGRRSEERDR